MASEHHTVDFAKVLSDELEAIRRRRQLIGLDAGDSNEPAAEPSGNKPDVVDEREAVLHVLRTEGLQVAAVVAVKERGQGPNGRIVRDGDDAQQSGCGGSGAL